MAQMLLLAGPGVLISTLCLGTAVKVCIWSLILTASEISSECTNNYSNQCTTDDFSLWLELEDIIITGRTS